MPGWETCSRTHSGTSGRAGSPPSSCARDRLAAPGGCGRAGRLPNACGGRPQRAARARRTPADPARGRRRPVAGRAVDEPPWSSRCGDCRATTSGCCSPAGLRGGTAGSELELALDSDLIERMHVGPLSPGALQGSCSRGSAGSFARPTLLRLHEASGGNPFFALELGRVLGTRRSTPLSRCPCRRSLDALVRARLDGLPGETRRALLLACTHGRLTPDQLDGDTLEPAFADNVIELADGVIRFTHPLLASVLYQAASPSARRRAHERLAEIVDDPLARARHRALAAQEPDAELAAELEAAAASRWLAALRSPPRSSASTPFVRRLLSATRIGFTGARSRLRVPISLRAKGLRPRAIALELVADAPPGATRAEALALLADLEGPQQRSRAARGGARTRRQGTLHSSVAALAARLSRALHAGAGCGPRSMRVWRSSSPRARRRRAPRRCHCPVSPSLRSNCGDAGAPRLAERAHELAVASRRPAAGAEGGRWLARPRSHLVRRHRACACLLRVSPYGGGATGTSASRCHRALVPGPGRAAGGSLAAGGRVRRERT